MPPKRRRTITALSTALDSLRDRIHSFADTADEEQLREVAQLIERLSISNSGPFRLFDLPYELLEYTAESYFTRGEAAPILPVNRVFNELFANRVWKSIEFNNMMVHGRNVPQDVLVKNVRRIRAVDLKYIKPDFFVSGYFPFATSITFQVKKDMEMMFTLHLEQMKYLRRVTLRITKMSNDVISTAAEWINDSRRSGHVQHIVIDTACSSDYQQSLPLLASLMDKVESKKRIRLDCASLQPFPTSVIQSMPTTLTYLDLTEETPKGCRGEINKQVFNTVPDSVFVHLRTLYVQVCCSNSSLYNFQSFVPERFPVLSCLDLGVPKQSCNEEAGTPLTTIFSGKQWPSITELELVGNDTVVPKVGQLLFKAMPALHSCIFQCMDEVDISSDLDTCLTISRLTLYNTDLDTSNLRGKLPCLVYLELNYSKMDSNYLQFIESCKRLVEIKLIDCDIADDTIVTVSNYPCNSIRKAIFSASGYFTFTDRMAHLLPAFPNLRVLDLTHIEKEKHMSFISKCPAITILT